MAPARRAHVLALALALGAGCGAERAFHCATSDQCTLDGVAGHCEANGACSLPDATCPSGSRYVDQATADVAGQCVPPGGACTSAFTDVSAGARHTCAVNQAGEVWCWGDNRRLQLGSTGPSTTAPRQVTGVSGAQRVAAGDDHTCAVLGGGGVVCWGADDLGQLGRGLGGADALPGGQVGLIGGVTALAAGDRHGCAIDGNAGGWCWGDNSDHQVTGVLTHSATPLETLDLLDVGVAIAAGGSHSAAVLDDGTVLTWGKPNSPALGRGATADAAPAAITGLTARAIAAGEAHACAIGTDGKLRCWGDGGDGRLGVSGTQAAPALVPGLASVTDVSAGGRHTCVLLGTVLECFGANDQGQLGVAGGSSTTPVTVAGSWRQVSAGASHTCARADDDAVRCWGDNADGQLGTDGPSRSAPAAVTLACP